MKNWKHWTLGVIFLVLANFVYGQNSSSEELALLLGVPTTGEFRVNTEATFALFKAPLTPRGGNYYLVRYTWDNSNDSPRFGSSAFQIELLNNDDNVPLFGLNIRPIEYNTLTGRLNGQLFGSFKFVDTFQRLDNGPIMTCVITFGNTAQKILFQMDTGLW